MTAAVRGTSPRGIVLALAVATAVASGCAPRESVTRVYGGRVVPGPYAPPEAFGAFLRGAIAESVGAWKEAVASYELAHEWDPEDPLVLSRVGRARCLLDPKDSGADSAFRRALERDDTFADTWASKAICAATRGREADAAEARARARTLDPALVEGVGSAELRAPDPAGVRRDALLAATSSHGGGASAWDALADYSLAHGDMATGAYALAEVARRSASHRESVLRRARALLGAGYEAEARVVFAATVDAFADGGTLPRSSDDVRELVTFAGRIAVDDALAAGDVKKAEARAVRARLANDEVMGRAWLLGRVDDARASAEARLRAEPDHPGATLILLASGAGDARALRNVSVRPVSASTFVAFATWSRIAFDAADLHDLLRALPHAPASPGDPLLVRPQAALLADGVMDASDAVPEAVVEAALRRGELRATRVATILASADARHRLLWLALTDPSSKDVRDLARHLGPAVARDARVALADVALARADGRAVAGGTLARLVDSAVGDALVAGIATKLARDPAEKSRVKRALEGLAWTSWERRVVSE